MVRALLASEPDPGSVNAHAANHINPNGTQVSVSWFPKIAMYDKYLAMGMCQAYNPAYFAHIRDNHVTMNVLFSDGHVSTGTEDFGFLQQFPAGGSLDVVVKGWRAMEDLQDIWATLADGRNPATSLADPAIGAPNGTYPYTNRISAFQATLHEDWTY